MTINWLTDIDDEPIAAETCVWMWLTDRQKYESAARFELLASLCEQRLREIESNLLKTRVLAMADMETASHALAH